MKKHDPRAKKIEIIERHLRNYHQYKIGIKNLKLQLNSIMPSMTASYELREGSTGTFNIKSDTESFAIDRIESMRALALHEEMETYRLIIECIDAAMEGLDEDEQKFVEARFFNRYSAKKTAKSLGYSESNVFVTRRRIMDILIHSLGGLAQL